MLAPAHVLKVYTQLYLISMLHYEYACKHVSLGHNIFTEVHKYSHTTQDEMFMHVNAHTDACTRIRARIHTTWKQTFRLFVES